MIDCPMCGEPFEPRKMSNNACWQDHCPECRDDLARARDRHNRKARNRKAATKRTGQPSKARVEPPVQRKVVDCGDEGPHGLTQHERDMIDNLCPERDLPTATFHKLYALMRDNPAIRASCIPETK